MIKGMTGYGSSQITSGKVKGAIEIKSQNHRYLDIVFYLPNGFSGLENKIKQHVSRSILRGRVTVTLKITDKPGQTLFLNKDTVLEYLKYSRSLKREFAITQDISSSELLKLPGVITVKETSLDPDKLWPPVENGLKKALDSLMAMRLREGKSLSVDTIMILKKNAYAYQGHPISF